MIGAQIVGWWAVVSVAAGLFHCAIVEAQRLLGRARTRRVDRELAALCHRQEHRR